MDDFPENINVKSLSLWNEKHGSKFWKSHNLYCTLVPVWESLWNKKLLKSLTCSQWSRCDVDSCLDVLSRVSILCSQLPIDNVNTLMTSLTQLISLDTNQRSLKQIRDIVINVLSNNNSTNFRSLRNLFGTVLDVYKAIGSEKNHGPITVLLSFLCSHLRDQYPLAQETIDCQLMSVIVSKVDKFCTSPNGCVDENVQLLEAATFVAHQATESSHLKNLILVIFRYFQGSSEDRSSIILSSLTIVDQNLEKVLDVVIANQEGFVCLLSHSLRTSLSNRISLDQKRKANARSIGESMVCRIISLLHLRKASETTSQKRKEIIDRLLESLSSLVRNIVVSSTEPSSSVCSLCRLACSFPVESEGERQILARKMLDLAEQTSKRCSDDARLGHELLKYCSKIIQNSEDDDFKIRLLQCISNVLMTRTTEDSDDICEAVASAFQLEGKSNCLEIMFSKWEFFTPILSNVWLKAKNILHKRSPVEFVSDSLNSILNNSHLHLSSQWISHILKSSSEMSIDINILQSIAKEIVLSLSLVEQLSDSSMDCLRHLLKRGVSLNSTVLNSDPWLLARSLLVLPFEDFAGVDDLILKFAFYCIHDDVEHAGDAIIFLENSYTKLNEVDKEIVWNAARHRVNGGIGKNSIWPSHLRERAMFVSSIFENEFPKVPAESETFLPHFIDVPSTSFSFDAVNVLTTIIHNLEMENDDIILDTFRALVVGSTSEPLILTMISLLSCLDFDLPQRVFSHISQTTRQVGSILCGLPLIVTERILDSVFINYSMVNSWWIDPLLIVYLSSCRRRNKREHFDIVLFLLTSRLRARDSHAALILFAIRRELREADTDWIQHSLVDLIVNFLNEGWEANDCVFRIPAIKCLFRMIVDQNGLKTVHTKGMEESGCLSTLLSHIGNWLNKSNPKVSEADPVAEFAFLFINDIIGHLSGFLRSLEDYVDKAIIVFYKDQNIMLVREDIEKKCSQLQSIVGRNVQSSVNCDKVGRNVSAFLASQYLAHSVKLETNVLAELIKFAPEVHVWSPHALDVLTTTIRHILEDGTEKEKISLLVTIRRSGSLYADSRSVFEEILIGMDIPIDEDLLKLLLNCAIDWRSTSILCEVMIRAIQPVKNCPSKISNNVTFCLVGKCARVIMKRASSLSVGTLLSRLYSAISSFELADHKLHGFTTVLEPLISNCKVTRHFIEFAFVVIDDGRAKCKLEPGRWAELILRIRVMTSVIDRLPRRIISKHIEWRLSGVKKTLVLLCRSIFSYKPDFSRKGDLFAAAFELQCAVFDRWPEKGGNRLDSALAAQTINRLGTVCKWELREPIMKVSTFDLPDEEKDVEFDFTLLKKTLVDEKPGEERDYRLRDCADRIVAMIQKQKTHSEHSQWLTGFQSILCDRRPVAMHVQWMIMFVLCRVKENVPTFWESCSSIVCSLLKRIHYDGLPKLVLNIVDCILDTEMEFPSQIFFFHVFMTRLPFQVLTSLDSEYAIRVFEKLVLSGAFRLDEERKRDIVRECFLEEIPSRRRTLMLGMLCVLLKKKILTVSIDTVMNQLIPMYATLTNARRARVQICRVVGYCIGTMEDNERSSMCQLFMKTVSEQRFPSKIEVISVLAEGYPSIVKGFELELLKNSQFLTNESGVASLVDSFANIDLSVIETDIVRKLFEKSSSSNRTTTARILLSLCDYPLATVISKEFMTSSSEVLHEMLNTILRERNTRMVNQLLPLIYDSVFHLDSEISRLALSILMILPSHSDVTSVVKTALSKGLSVDFRLIGKIILARAEDSCFSGGLPGGTQQDSLRSTMCTDSVQSNLFDETQGILSEKKNVMELELDIEDLEEEEIESVSLSDSVFSVLSHDCALSRTLLDSYMKGHPEYKNLEDVLIHKAADGKRLFDNVEELSRLRFSLDQALFDSSTEWRSLTDKVFYERNGDSEVMYLGAHLFLRLADPSNSESSLVTAYEFWKRWSELLRSHWSEDVICDQDAVLLSISRLIFIPGPVEKIILRLSTTLRHRTQVEFSLRCLRSRLFLFSDSVVTEHDQYI